MRLQVEVRIKDNDKDKDLHRHIFDGARADRRFKSATFSGSA